MIVAHLDPDNALSDALQQITPQTLEKFVNQLVVRKTKLSPTLTTELDKIRRSINVLDGELLDVLSKRMEMINELAQYKKENNIQILQPKRWKEILLKALEKAKEKGLSERFIKNLFTKIHIESIKLQSKIMNEEN